MPQLVKVVEFPSHLAGAPRCAQCNTPMAICCVEPHPGDAGKDVQVYECKTCGLLDHVVAARD